MTCEATHLRRYRLKVHALGREHALPYVQEMDMRSPFTGLLAMPFLETASMPWQGIRLATWLVGGIARDKGSKATAPALRHSFTLTATGGMRSPKNGTMDLSASRFGNLTFCELHTQSFCAGVVESPT